DLKAGKVIIQTYSPEHYAIDAAARYDYATFYKKELIYRRENNNPPSQRMARLLYSHTNEEHCRQESQRVLEFLKGEITSSGLPNINITGPSPAYIERLRGKYRWQIIVRSPDPILLLKNIYLPHGWSIDIDPFGLL
ncbi:MAG: primosomal protein N', partial [Chloroflexi bacterium]|nr:primosomal protein N' [Chloroflexota bacterium]